MSWCSPSVKKTQEDRALRAPHPDLFPVLAGRRRPCANRRRHFQGRRTPFGRGIAACAFERFRRARGPAERSTVLATARHWGAPFRIGRISFFCKASKGKGKEREKGPLILTWLTHSRPLARPARGLCLRQISCAASQAAQVPFGREKETRRACSRGSSGN